MTGASKILTVSYGTFSCTLEGFDDPFNTMKAIAEYFRDLAAGDRYFGAEPPIPDAAMLHRIAEREIHRRVEAKIQDNGVILRAGDSDDLPAAEAPRPVLLDAEIGSETVAARLQRIRARHAGKAVAETTASLAVTAVADQPDTYSEDQHAEESARPDLEPVPEISGPLVEMIDIPDQIEDILDEAENDQALAEFDDSLAELPMGQPEAAFDVPEALVVPQPVAPEPVAEEISLPEPEAAVQPEPASLIVDADQSPPMSAEEAMLASLSADLPEDYAPLVDTTGEPVDLPEDFAPAGTGFDEDEMLSRLATVEPVAVEPVAAQPVLAAPVLADEGEDVDTDDDLTFDALTFEAQTSEPQTSEGHTPEVQTLEAAPQDSPVDPQPLIESLDQAAPEAQIEPTATQPAGRARARVIRIRRVDAPATPPVAEAPATEVTAAPVLLAPATETLTTALSDEAEAALQAELAALEAEIGGFASAPEPVRAHENIPQVTTLLAAEADLVAPAADQPEPSAEPVITARQHIAPPAEDEAVNRLMAQAASEMGDEETRRRQAAIAHLKAAVAATEADRKFTTEPGSGGKGRLDAYRDDLERVVRPRRPVAESSTARPAAPTETAQRPTPLVLVSAQRIDVPQAGEPAPVAQPAGPRVVMPVRPRRVTSAVEALPFTATEPTPDAPVAAVVMQKPDQAAYDEDDILAPGETDNVFADATSFQDFADQLGASALPDLLEAAAVYCAEVLQRPEFSRPLVMRQISGLANQSATAREDYLRGFGTLLRQGRITKVKRGMFALTDRSPYLAEARKLAG